jgi:putative transposase
MSRHIEGSTYHIYNRGAHRLQIFLTRDNYIYCRRLITKYTQKYSVSLLGYCLMPNHYHFILRQLPGGSISRCVQTIFNSYVQGFNKIQKHSGTLFQGSAKSRLVDSDLYAVQLIRYVHLNPVRAGLAQRPEAWEYSDYLDWIYDRGHHSSIQFRRLFFENGTHYKEFADSFAIERDKAPIAKYIFGYL